MVSVSKTISRMAPLNTRRQAETSQDIPHLGAGFFRGCRRCRRQSRRAPAFPRRAAAGRGSARTSRRSSRAWQDPLALQLGRRRRRSPCRTPRRRRFRTAAGCRTAAPAIAMLDDEAGALMMRPRDGRSPRARPAHRGRRAPPPTRRRGRPRRRASCRGTRLDQRDQGPAAGPLQRRTTGIGIESRDAGVGEHGRDGRLAHADRSGQRERDHA